MGKTADICRATCLGLSVVIAITLLIGLTASLGFFLALLLSILIAVLAWAGLSKGICAPEMRAGRDVHGGTGKVSREGETLVAEAMFAPRAEPAPTGAAASGGTSPAVPEEAQPARAAAAETPPATPAAAPAATTPDTVAEDRLLEPDAEDAEARDPVHPVAPQGLTAPRSGGADDLKKIKGLGPKAETTLNEMGIHHFAQIASWTVAEVAWVEENLKGFKGRVTRDDWVAQARAFLSDGGA